MATLNIVGLRTSAKVKELNIGITRSQTPARYESHCYLSVVSLICGYGISDDDQYNMDEKGFMRGIGDDAK